jgi:hypothetical protein
VAEDQMGRRAPEGDPRPRTLIVPSASTVAMSPGSDQQVPCDSTKVATDFSGSPKYPIGTCPLRPNLPITPDPGTTGRRSSPSTFVHSFTRRRGAPNGCVARRLRGLAPGWNRRWRRRRGGGYPGLGLPRFVPPPQPTPHPRPDDRASDHGRRRRERLPGRVPLELRGQG